MNSKGKQTGIPRWLPWFFPSMADILFIALLGLVLGLRSQQLLNADGDLARHLAVGQRILATGTIPTVDLFSYTKGGQPFTPYEWLSEVIFAAVYLRLGLAGVATLAAAIAALPFLLLMRWAVRDGANPFVAVGLVTAGALASSMHWLARPHLFTILLAVLWTRALMRHRSTGSLRPLLLLPPMMALWANLHGGFLVGFVILGVFLAGGFVQSRWEDWATEPFERPSMEQHDADIAGGQALVSGSRNRQGLVAMSVAGVLSLAAVGLNPVGYRLLSHVTGFLHSRFLVDNTEEYLSPNFHDLGPQLFLVLLLVAMVSLAMNRRRVDLVDLGMLVVWTAFALYSARNIPLFAAICLPMVIGLVSQLLKDLGAGMNRARRLATIERQMGGPLLPLLAVAVALLISMGDLGGLHPKIGFDPKTFPVEALAKAKSVGVRGNLFNYFPWGGYVLYAGYPRYRVFIDGQTDFYGERLTRDYLEVARLEPGWESVLDRYQVGWVLFPHESPLSLLLARTHGWRLVYQDGTADIFIRER